MILILILFLSSTLRIVHPNTDDGSCSELVVFGCADSTYIEYWDYSNNTLTPPILLLMLMMVRVLIL